MQDAIFMIHQLSRLFLFVFAVILQLQAVHATPASSLSDVQSEPIRQQITVAVIKNFPPYYLPDKNGKPQGFAIDILGEMARSAGLEITYLVKDNWVQATEALREGEADLIPNLGITEIKNTHLDFTNPIEVSPISIITRSEANGIRSFEDLSGKVIGVVKHSVGFQIASKLINKKFVIFEQPESALIGLLAGHLDALIYSKTGMLKIVRESSLEDRIKIIGKPLKEIKMAFAIRKEDTELLNKLNVAIAEFSNSQYYETIIEKWYGKSEELWVISNVVLIAGSIVFLIIILSILWRYFTLVSINKQLEKTIKECKKVKGELQESRFLLGNVLNSTPDLIFVKNKKLEIVLCNLADFTAIDKTPNEMYGHTDIKNSCNPELVKGCPARYICSFGQDDWEVLAGKSIHNSHDATNVGGEAQIFDTQKLPLLNSEGEIIGVLGVARDITELKRTEETVHKIAVGVSAQIGEEFFQSLAMNLIKIFNVKFTFIGLLDERRPDMIDTVALCAHGEIIDNLSYELAHTPCQSVIEATYDHIQIYPRDLQQLFPDDPLLEEMDVHSYIGAPLLDTTGKPIGLIALMDNNPMENTEMVETILKIFAVRAAAELERLRAEQALRNSEEGLADAQRLAHIGNWELDLVTNKLEWSNEIYRIFEIDSHKFGATYEAFLNLIYPDDREQVNAAYMESVKNKTSYAIDHRLQMSDGTIKYVQECCETFFDDEGIPIRSIGTVQDITEQYLTAQSLKRLNRSLRVLSACNEIMMRATNEEELLNNVCRIIVEISGYRLAWVGFSEPNEARTIQPVAQAGHEEGYLDMVKLTCNDIEWEKSPTNAAIRTGKPSIIHNIPEDSRYAQWHNSALERGYYSSIALPLKNKKQIYGTLNIYAHEEDAFDEEEVQLLQELANDIAYGIAMLRSQQEHHVLNKQLQQAQKMEAIGQLTGGIAHDFNNILASILGFTNLALQRFVSDDQPELREYLGEVSHAGERARDLVSQMLAFSREEKSNVTQLQLKPVMEDVTKILRATLPSSIQLSREIGADVPAIMMDMVQLQQVLMTMCINARDAVDDIGQIDIWGCRTSIIECDQYDLQTETDNVIQCRTCDACHNEIDEGDYVELSVRDSGTGIEDDILKRIFEPFFTTKEVGKGTGMGLSMVHGIIHQHGGHILVDSKPGIGTTFRLLFPVEKCASSHRPDNQTEVNIVPKKIDDTRLLIVDDEESVARFIGDLFESNGWKVTVMTNSQAALDLFSQAPTSFDLIITDQTMPELTGVELAKRVLEQRPALPIILCTGYSEHVDKTKAKALGIRGYLTKPMQTNALLNLAQSLIV